MDSIQEINRTPSPASKPHITVVSPFFNEEGILSKTVIKMVALLQEQFEEWELILVNDGSVDASLDRATETLDTLQEPRVRLFSSPINQGRGWALKTGIDAARGDIIVTTEADLSWGSDIIKRMVAELDNDPTLHFVVASPHMPGGGFEAVPWKREMLSKLGNRLIRLFFDSKITMHTGMTRAYRREVVQPLEVYENSKAFHLEVLLKLIAFGFRYKEVPALLSWKERLASAATSSQPTIPRKKGIRSPISRAIVSHFRFLFVVQPMRYFGMLTLLSALGAAGFLVGSIWNYLQGGVAIFLLLIAFILGLFSLLFLGFSVMFVQLREISISNWRKGYQGRGMPSVHPGEEIFDGRSDLD
jgi:glycosyltransferase involved in cell wall biosynthesis